MSLSHVPRTDGMPTSKLTTLPANRPLRLRNVTCPYCGALLNAANTSRDHVIGRRFVPKGLLANQWNLLLNACRVCNNHKSDLEDDISAITMLPDLLGRHHMEHPQLAADAKNKAINARSRRTGRRVSESRETMEIKFNLGGATLTFNMVSQPQIDEMRAHELARLQFAAFFYLITYQKEQQRGFYWLGKYAPILVISRLDWGNARARGFMTATSEWEPRFIGGTADGFFWAAIRRSPTEEIWSLALEWNGNYRVLAACGAEAPLRAFVESLPKLEMNIAAGTPENYVAARTEIPLSDTEDTLFSWYHPE